MSALKTSGDYLTPNWSDYWCIYQLSCFGAQSLWFLNGWIISTVQKSSNYKEKHVRYVSCWIFKKKIYVNEDEEEEWKNKPERTFTIVEEESLSQSKWEEARETEVDVKSRSRSHSCCRAHAQTSPLWISVSPSLNESQLELVIQQDPFRFQHSFAPLPSSFQMPCSWI